MKKRLVPFIIILVSVLLFCGCSNFDITCSIDEDNTAQMLLEITVSNEDLTEDESINLLASINRLKRHLKENDYTVDFYEEDSTFILTAKKSKKCEDAKSALSALMGFMSEEASPFLHVEGGYSPSYFNDIYNLNAQLDFSNIISDEFLESLTPSHKEIIKEAIASSTGSVTFDIWGETVEYTGELNDSKNTTQVTLSEPVTLSRAVKIYNEDNIKEHEDLVQKIESLATEKQKYTTALHILITLASAILIASIIFIIMRKSKGDNTTSENPE